MSLYFKQENEDELVELNEEQMPDLAKKAFRAAYDRALASGEGVMVSENDALWLVYADGRREFVKSLPPRTKVTRGSKLVLS